MSIRIPLIVTVILAGAMLGLSLWAWPLLPAHTPIVTHWDFNGRPNGYMGKTMALLFGPVGAILLSSLFALFPRIEPRKINLASSAKFYRAVWIGSLCVLMVAHGVIVATALHHALNVGGVLMSTVAGLFIVLGNYLGKTRSNFFAGVRTPWTLSSEYSWEHTHRLAGRLFMATGAATIAALIVYPSKIAIFVLLAMTTLTAVVAIVMSYIYWSRDPARYTGRLVQ